MKAVTLVGATPNRVRILFDLLAHKGEGGEAREVAAALLGPSRLARAEDAGEDNAFQDCLAASDEMGLLERDGDLLRVRPPEAGGNDATFLARAERALLPFGVSVADPEGAYAGAVAWMLCQDPRRGLPWNGTPSALSLKMSQLGEAAPAFLMTADLRFQQAVYWARFLGLVTRMNWNGRDVVVPDPTAAIARHLDAALAPGTEKTLTAFVADLARSCPVLEGAGARQEVEAMLRPPAMKREERQLSGSTVLALSRLKARGLLSFRHLADGQTWRAEGLGEGGRITHVSRSEGVRR